MNKENIQKRNKPSELAVGVDTIVIRLLKNTKKMNELIHGLDDVARDMCSYEYGLPISDDGQMARMREVIIKWIAGV